MPGVLRFQCRQKNKLLGFEVVAVLEQVSKMVKGLGEVGRMWMPQTCWLVCGAFVVPI